MLVQIYVDDIIFCSTNDQLCRNFSKLMQSNYQMSMMGELTFFLGLQVKQTKNGIFINQGKYTKDLLKKFKFDQSASARTPISASIKVKDAACSTSTSKTAYRGMIGSLVYLTASRPDIMFATCYFARF